MEMSNIPMSSESLRISPREISQYDRMRQGSIMIGSEALKPMSDKRRNLSSLAAPNILFPQSTRHSQLKRTTGNFSTFKQSPRNLMTPTQMD